jgi:cyclopropane-fatty-acyl-phospholipid synthase
MLMTDTISSVIDQFRYPVLPPAPAWATAEEIARQIDHDLRSNVHYDMPIEVFGYILGPSMKYSCGLWDADHPTLETAQAANLQQVVASLGLTPDSHVLDVGYGWGAFALYAARQTGCRVTGLSLAPHQQAYVQERARAEGVADRVDFRIGHILALPDPPGTFSHMVFFETLEHMRLKRETLARCRGALRPDGMIYIQVIGVKNAAYREQMLTTAGTAHIYETYGDVGDPAPLSTVITALEDNEFEIERVHSMTPHYLSTLRAWADNTHTHRAAIDALTEPGRAAALRKYFMLGWFGYRQGVGVLHQIWATPRPARSAGG